MLPEQELGTTVDAEPKRLRVHLPGEVGGGGCKACATGEHEECEAG
jgi:hypothetical protein